jgi:hypothetical protein
MSIHTAPGTLVAATVAGRTANVAYDPMTTTAAALCAAVGDALALDARTLRVTVSGITIPNNVAALVAEVAGVPPMTAATRLVAIGMRRAVARGDTPPPGAGSPRSRALSPASRHQGPLGQLHCPQGFEQLTRMFDRAADDTARRQVVAENASLTAAAKYIGESDDADGALQEVLEQASQQAPAFVELVRAHPQLLLDALNGRPQQFYFLPPSSWLPGFEAAVDGQPDGVATTSEAAAAMLIALLRDLDVNTAVSTLSAAVAADSNEQSRDMDSQRASPQQVVVTHNGITSSPISIVPQSGAASSASGSVQQAPFAQQLATPDAADTPESAMAAEVEALTIELLRAQTTNDELDITFQHYRLFHRFKKGYLVSELGAGGNEHERFGTPPSASISEQGGAAELSCEDDAPGDLPAARESILSACGVIAACVRKIAQRARSGKLTNSSRRRLTADDVCCARDILMLAWIVFTAAILFFADDDAGDDAALSLSLSMLLRGIVDAGDISITMMDKALLGGSGGAAGGGNPYAQQSSKKATAQSPVTAAGAPMPPSGPSSPLVVRKLADIEGAIASLVDIARGDGTTFVVYSDALPYATEVDCAEVFSRMVMSHLELSDSINQLRAPTAESVSLAYVVSPGGLVTATLLTGAVAAATQSADAMRRAAGKRASGVNVAMAWADGLQQLHRALLDPVARYLPGDEHRPPSEGGAAPPTPPPAGGGDNAMVFMALFSEQPLPFHAMRDAAGAPLLRRGVVSLSPGPDHSVEVRGRDEALVVRSQVVEAFRGECAFLSRRLRRLVAVGNATPQEAHLSMRWSLLFDVAPPRPAEGSFDCCDLFVSSALCTAEAFATTAVRAAVVPILSDGSVEAERLYACVGGGAHDDDSGHDDEGAAGDAVGEGACYDAFQQELSRLFMAGLLPGGGGGAVRQPKAEPVSVGCAWRSAMLQLLDGPACTATRWAGAALLHVPLALHRLAARAAAADDQYRTRAQQVAARLTPVPPQPRQAVPAASVLSAAELRNVRYLQQHDVAALYDTLLRELLAGKPEGEGAVVDAMLATLERHVGAQPLASPRSSGGGQRQQADELQDASASATHGQE